MKKLIIFIFCFIICVDIIDNKFLNNELYNYIKTFINKDQYNIVINENKLNNGKYKYNEFSTHVRSTTDFFPKNKDELLNMYYTFLNNGLNDFTYYCDKNYSTCIDDIKDASNDANIFSYINQLVHPYNSFEEINSKYNGVTKRVDIIISKKYSDDDIIKIDNKINEICNKININRYDSIKDKIKAFHDYIADNSVYDRNKESGNSNYHSDSAIGTLFEGYSICSGYSDTMAIFLSKLGLDNVKVITDKHVWNAVKIDNKWYHIDLTWDDPVILNGGNTISHDYFLITSDQIYIKDKTQHKYDKDLYDFLN